MTQWYYAQNSQQRQGPLPAESLVELYRSGRIGLDTLVWRDGQIQWQPLADFAAELGLSARPGAPLPPPLPPAHAAFAANRADAPPRSGLSGCMIALIVGAVLAIPMLGILAAIALPAYQDFTLRAKLAGVLPQAAPLKTAVAEHHAQYETCPGNDDAGFGAPESYASGHLASATVGAFDSGQCGIELILGGTGNERLDGKALWLEYEPATTTWRCSSEIDDRYLPSQCRG